MHCGSRSADLEYLCECSARSSLDRVPMKPLLLAGGSHGVLVPVRNSECVHCLTSRLHRLIVHEPSRGLPLSQISTHAKNHDRGSGRLVRQAFVAGSALMLERFIATRESSIRNQFNSPHIPSPRTPNTSADSTRTLLPGTPATGISSVPRSCQHT